MLLYVLREVFYQYTWLQKHIHTHVDTARTTFYNAICPMTDDINDIYRCKITKGPWNHADSDKRLIMA
jgi:hypothetical protein